MKTLAKITIASILGLIVSTAANASLIVNGGFEDADVENGWEWYTSDQVAGWDGSNIEIWDNFGSIGPYEGEKHAELNAHPNGGTGFSIFQSFATVEGASYELFFAYGARSSIHEELRVELLGTDSMLNALISDHAVNEWSTFSHIFTADSSETMLRFTAVNPITGTVGNFLDGISVVEVPAPGTLLLLGGALIGFGLRRKK